MPRRDPVSIFWGPHRTFEDLAQWPPTIQLHVTLHGLIPGTAGPPTIPPVLLATHILTPSLTPGLWRAVPRGIDYTLIHTTLQRTLIVIQTTTFLPIYALTLPFAINRWAYNSITDPAGVFAFGGSATLSWKEP